MTGNITQEQCRQKALSIVRDARGRYVTNSDGYQAMMTEALVYATLATIPDKSTPPGGYA